jgi:hypothetical protein
VCKEAQFGPQWVPGRSRYPAEEPTWLAERVLELGLRLESDGSVFVVYFPIRVKNAHGPHVNTARQQVQWAERMELRSKLRT